MRVRRLRRNVTGVAPAIADRDCTRQADTVMLGTLEIDSCGHARPPCTRPMIARRPRRGDSSQRWIPDCGTNPRTAPTGREAPHRVDIRDSPTAVSSTVRPRGRRARWIGAVHGRAGLATAVYLERRLATVCSLGGLADRDSDVLPGQPRPGNIPGAAVQPALPDRKCRDSSASPLFCSELRLSGQLTWRRRCFDDRSHVISDTVMLAAGESTRVSLQLRDEVKRAPMASLFTEWTFCPTAGSRDSMKTSFGSRARCACRPCAMSRRRHDSSFASPTAGRSCTARSRP